ncbi:MAG: hypothetical protein FJZ01_19520 [Candidatus Sericytochromatia bacterium]|nr:hypothetical protein [Candidatus Tanganyikabacteria bacterium]
MSHPLVFQVQGRTHSDDLESAAEELLDLVGNHPVQLSYGSRDRASVLGVVEECDEVDAGRIIGDLRRLSRAHPMLRVSLGGFGGELPPTVVENGRFVLFGEAYRSFCSSPN